MKGIWVLAVAFSFVLGSLVTGASVFADEDDEALSFLCPVGQSLVGIVFEDDDDGHGHDHDDDLLDFICGTAAVPGTYFLTAFDTASKGVDADVTLGCDPGDTFVSGSAFAGRRGNGESLPIPISEAQDDGAGGIEWHATGFFPDVRGSVDLTVTVICLDTNP